MEVLGKMASLPVTRRLLHESGAGRELNNDFFRTNKCIALRQHSRGLIRCWRNLISLQDAVAASAEAAGNPHAGPKSHSCSSVPSGGEHNEHSEKPANDSGVYGHANPERSADTDLTRRTVTELKATITELGLDASLCIEKSELVELLRSVSPSRTPIRGVKRLSLRSQDRRSSLRAARRKSLVAAVGRKSWLRAAAHAAKPVQNKAKGAAGSAQRREHLQHIAQATDDFAALGLLRAELQAMPLKARSKLVLHKWRKLAAVVHPDKCSPDLTTLATRAFRRLAAAKSRILLQS